MVAGRQRNRSVLFRYSYLDLLSIAVIPVHAAIFVLVALEWDQLSWPMCAALAPLFLLMSVQNTGANHNHYHTPIFRKEWLNSLVGIGFSLEDGPKTPYNIGHGLHHRSTGSENESKVLEVMGFTPKPQRIFVDFVDFVLTWSGLKYVAAMVMLERWSFDRIANLFRVGGTNQDASSSIVMTILRTLKDNDDLRRRCKLEIAFSMAFRATLIVISWEFVVFFLLPVQFLISRIRATENFLQHWGATDPTDPLRDSVSCYGTFYNLLTFNLGYHQEHHYKAGVHWLELPRLRAKMPDDRRIVPFTHYINLPLFYPSVARSLANQRKADAPVVTSQPETSVPSES